MVDDFVFIDRRAQLSHRVWILLEEFNDLTLLAGEIARFADQRLLNFLLGDLDFGNAANFCEHEAETDAALSNLVILFFQLILRLVFVFFGGAPGIHFSLQLLPDLVEFLLNHFRRQIKIMLFVEQIEQAPFGFRSGRAAKLVLDLIRNQFFQFGEVVEPEALGEFVVDFWCFGFTNFVDLDFKHGVFAGEVLGLIVFREGHIDFGLVAGLDADQLLLKPRNERVGADHQCVFFSGAAFKRFAV